MLISQFILVTLSAVLHALWNFYAKKAPQKIEIITVGFAVATALFAPLLYLEESLPSETGVRLALLTGFVLAVYVVLLYRAYHIACLTLIYPLSRGFGVMGTFVIEWTLSPHPFSLREILGISIIAVGTSCLAFPHLKKGEMPGVFYSLAIGVLLSIAFVLGRFSTNHISAFSYLWGMYAACLFCLLPFVIVNFKSRIKEAITSYSPVAAIIGVGSFLSYLAVVYLFKTMPAATVIAVRELSVVFGAILGFVFLREKLTFLNGVSILAIAVGAIVLKFK